MVLVQFSLKMCIVVTLKSLKIHEKPLFLGFKVIDVGTTGKLVGSACCDSGAKITSLETRDSRPSYGENPESLSDLGVILYRVVTPGWTDRQTDGQNSHS